MDDIDIASLLASRLCHDVVGPVGAIQNGLELMEEDSAMTAEALELIKKSAAQATAKLQYARMAYGTAGGVDVLDPAEAGRLTAGLFEGERAELDWDWSGAAEAKTSVKLAMLLATFALGAVPRGGRVSVRHANGTVDVAAEGSVIRTPPFMDVLQSGSAITDPRAVQALTIARLAAGAGQRLDVETSETAMRFRTVAA